MVRIFSYDELPNADLIVDAIYEGKSGGLLSSEALSHLLPGVGNRGGFRASGRGDKNKNFVALFTSGEDKDWPDLLYTNTGRFIYYGDNKKPGHELHVTNLGGNRILRHVFGLLHESPPQRHLIPPFLIFKQYRTNLSAHSLQYKGLGVPGSAGLPATEDLIAIWKTSDGQRFQNYRATFTILDVPTVSRQWLDDLRAGNRNSCHEPNAWREWIETGRYKALIAENTTVIRTQDKQMPDTATRSDILEAVWNYFKDASHAFESFAAWLFGIYDQRVVVDELTRSSVDGGRDAVGRYLLGLNDDPVYVEFSLEAKCYRPPLNGQTGNRVGVKEVSRLISRIRHRQFGVLVTTSTIGSQAYGEVRRDRHPIIFICGKDIADILTTKGFNTAPLVKDMLAKEFPRPQDVSDS